MGVALVMKHVFGNLSRNAKASHSFHYRSSFNSYTL